MNATKWRKHKFNHIQLLRWITSIDFKTLEHSDTLISSAHFFNFGPLNYYQAGLLISKEENNGKRMKENIKSKIVFWRIKKKKKHWPID